MQGKENEKREKIRTGMIKPFLFGILRENEKQEKIRTVILKPLLFGILRIIIVTVTNPQIAVTPAASIPLLAVLKDGPHGKECCLGNIHCWRGQ
jgi:hypothetical protein